MTRKRKGDPIHGWVLFNKPVGMTSTQAVGFVRRVFNAQKAGHGGTLDPLADGVLPIALGEATKLMNYVLQADKTYRFTIKFGAATETDDAEGEVIATSDKRPTEDQLRQVLHLFTGTIQQLPPKYSAIKKQGQAAYKLARAGKEVELEPRTVTVHKLEVESFTPEEAVLVATVTKGTYVRSLARDIGEELGCYGHVTQLTRVAVSGFSLQECVDKETLESVDNLGQSAPHLKGLATVLDDIPAYAATPAEIVMLKRGNTFHRVHLSPGVMKVLDRHGNLVSLVEVDRIGKVSILRNFNI